MAARVLTRVPITYEVASGGTTHAPMVMASVGGAPEARYVLDTGSEVHLLNEDLADELGLTKVPGEEGTDHSGATMPSWDVGSVGCTLGGLDLTLRDVVSIPAPPPFPGFGVRGILSPQHLHPSAWAVLDMANDELLLVEGTDEELEAFLSPMSPALTMLRLPRDEGFTSVVVPAAIEGFDEMPAMIDTGGKRTEVAASAVSGMTAESPGHAGAGVSGVSYAGASAGAQTLVVQGHRLAVPALHVRDAMPDPAIIGMDVLRGTVVACAADLARPVFWQVQPPANSRVSSTAPRPRFRAGVGACPSFAVPALALPQKPACGSDLGPNCGPGSGVRAQIGQSSDPGAEVFGSLDQSVNTIRLILRRIIDYGLKTGSVAYTWNGRLPNGKLAPAGKYKFVAKAVDLAGNVKKKTIYVKVVR